MKNIQQSTEKETERENHIDLLKFIATFFVMLYHSELYEYDFLQSGNFIEYFTYFFRIILSTCVPVFFFANGYLLFSKKFELNKHIKKTLKIVWLTIIWGIINLLCIMVIKKQYLSPLEFIQGLLQWKEGWINFLWYMGAITCIYIFFPLLKNAYDTNKNIFLYFTIAVAILTFGNVLLNGVTTLYFDLFLQEPILVSEYNFFNMFNPFRGIYGYSFVYFCVGGWMYFIKDKILSIDARKRNCVAILGIIISCVCLFTIGVYFSNISGEIWDAVWKGYDTIFTFINVILIFVLCLNFKKQNNFIKSISCNTLGIYFVHILFLNLTQPFMLSIQNFCNIPISIVYAIFLLGISWVTSIVLRKIPVVRLLIKY